MLLNRCGMIYMEPILLGWKPLVASWMEQQLPDCLNAEQRNIIRVSGLGDIQVLHYASFLEL